MKILTITSVCTADVTETWTFRVPDEWQMPPKEQRAGLLDDALLDDAVELVSTEDQSGDEHDREVRNAELSPDMDSVAPYARTAADVSAFRFKFSDQYGATYEPWTDGHSVGFKVTRDGRTCYLSISPSIGSDAVNDDTTVAFIREGETPETDEAQVHFDLFGSKVVSGD